MSPAPNDLAGVPLQLLHRPPQTPRASPAGRDAFSIPRTLRCSSGSHPRQAASRGGRDRTEAAPPRLVRGEIKVFVLRLGPNLFLIFENPGTPVAFWSSVHQYKVPLLSHQGYRGEWELIFPVAIDGVRNPDEQSLTGRKMAGNSTCLLSLGLTEKLS